MTPVSREPAQMTSRSAAATASVAFACAGVAGCRNRRLTGEAGWRCMICHSPMARRPSSSSAPIWVSASDTGSTRCARPAASRMSATAALRLPCWAVSAARIKFPTLTPSRSPAENRCCSSRAHGDSPSTSAARHWRVSPTCGMPNWRRSWPLCPPLSVTPTMAVTWHACFRNPRSSVACPVPLPSVTICMTGLFLPHTLRLQPPPRRRAVQIPGIAAVFGAPKFVGHPAFVG